MGNQRIECNLGWYENNINCRIISVVFQCETAIESRGKWRGRRKGRKRREGRREGGDGGGNLRERDRWDLEGCGDLALHSH